MREWQLKEICELIDTMCQAHEEIKEELKLNKKEKALIMLVQCQECAVTLGNYIEKIEGEGFITVTHIEEYCEMVFNFYEEINGTEYNENKIYKSLKKQFLKIENSVKNDIHIRKEIAFFPYKTSMWDSLESVYLSAKENPGCDVYCVPIPYFDLNTDHSFGLMHYEGLDYPKNIECIDYKTYDFEERKPDVIYIHNPYDYGNIVTSVHPRFYSANLKKYTKELIYIPYFVLPEIEPNDQASIEGMKHFCFLPGIINADKVIVQSEKMKQIYINEYMREAKANGLEGKHQDRNLLEQKFLGLGSPKFDKVLKTKKEDLEIPTDWLKIIQKPDGSWKKIIFYNTGIAALLQYGQQWVDKIEDVLRTFKEIQNDVALLWRPHPLIESTMKSMRPEVIQKYQAIKQKYLNEGWGIYDDTADMDRAVILSDAYYGDQSSVEIVYSKTKKPTLRQAIWMQCSHDKRINIQMEAGIIINQQIFFTIPRYEKFYCANLQTGVVECIDNIEGRRKTQEDKYKYATILDNNIFFFSHITGEIAILNPNTLKIRRGKIDNSQISNMQYLGNYNNSLYFIDENCSEIAVLKNNTIAKRKLGVGDGAENEQSVFWHFQSRCSIIWKIDVVNHKKQKIKQINSKYIEGKKSYITFLTEENRFMIFPDMSKKYLSYNICKNEVREYDISSGATGFLGGQAAFRKLEGEGVNYLSSMFSSDIFHIEKNEMKQIIKIGITSTNESYQEILRDLIKNEATNELFLDLDTFMYYLQINRG